MTAEAVVLMVAMAVAAGLVGSFAVMRHMSLAADPLSHIALPGIGIALALHHQPIFGAVAALLVGAVLIWFLEGRAQIPTDAIIGVVFSAALAIGTLTTTGEDLIDALFGSGAAPTTAEFAFVVVAAIAIIVFVLAMRNRLIITIMSPDIARTAGVNARLLELAYLVMFALTIAIGLRYLGVLLMGALIIIPAVTANRLARNLREMLRLTVGTSVAVTIAGAGAASFLNLQTGPVIVLVAAAVFVVSLLGSRPATSRSQKPVATK